MRLMLRLAAVMVFLGVFGSLSHAAVTITGLNLQVIQNQQVPPGGWHAHARVSMLLELA